MQKTVSCSLTFFPCASKIFEGKEEPTFGADLKYACVFVFLYSLFLKAHISEPITLADKYPWIFLCQIKAIITKHGNCLVAPWGRGGLI